MTGLDPVVGLQAVLPEERLLLFAGVPFLLFAAILALMLVIEIVTGF